MTYEIEFKPSARRDLDKLDKEDQARVLRAIYALRDNPRPHGAIKLAGRENEYRIRVGQLRAIYEIHDKKLLIYVIEVGWRREVYR